MSTPRPASSRLPDIRFPAIESQVLENGLTVLVVEDRRLPRVTIRLAVPAGRSANPSDNASLMDLTFELLKEGAGSRSAVEVATFMDRWALEYDSSPYMEQTVVSVSSLSVHRDAALEFLADVALRPAFAVEELDRLKIRLRSQLKAQRSSADFLASERLFLDYFGAGHPYSRVSFSIEEMERVDTEAIRNCWSNAVRPHSSLLLMAGDVDLDEAVNLADKFFGHWSGAGAARPDPTPGPERSQQRRVLVSRPHSQQARLVIGLPGLARAHHHWNALRLTSRLLGGGGSARLFLNLREDKGYTYGIYSYLRGYRNDGLLIASTDLNSDTVAAALDEIFREMRGLASHPPGEAELERGRAELVGGLLRRLETPGSIGTMELSRRLFDLDESYYSRYVSELSALGADDVAEIARRMLVPEKATIVAVGDPDVLRPQLEPLGSITVFDQEGQRIDNR